MKKFSEVLVIVLVAIVIMFILFVVKQVVHAKPTPTRPSKEIIIEKEIQCPALDQAVQKLYEARSKEFQRRNPDYTFIKPEVELLFCISKKQANFRVVTEAIFIDNNVKMCIMSTIYIQATIKNTSDIEFEFTMEPQYESCEIKKVKKKGK